MSWNFRHGGLSRHHATATCDARRRTIPPRMAASAIAIATCAMFVSWSAPAHAAMYKCRGADGRTTYSDQPCAKGADTWKPRASITVMPAASLTGRAAVGKAETGDKRPEWLRPLDPIGDCKRKGGRIDRELRACIVP